MSNEKDVAIDGSIGFLPLLFIVFLTLKLTDVIDWSWWYVAMPMYLIPMIVMGIIVSALFILTMFTVITCIIKLFKGRNK